MNLSSLFKRSVTACGLLPFWEGRITRWPCCILYHVIGDGFPAFIQKDATPRHVFDEQLRLLKKRYHFLTWSEYKEVCDNPKESKRTMLLTVDDGFRKTWEVLQEIASDHGVPSVSFVNTRTLNNAYLPWHTQYYFLQSEGGEKFLDPLWKSIGRPSSPADTRKHLHLNFDLVKVVAPIEEGLKSYGTTPAEVAERFALFIGVEDLKSRGSLMAVGDHSHSHYTLGRLSDGELDADLALSHALLAQILGQSPEAFAPPFGGQIVPFDTRCLNRLRRQAEYPYIFSAHESAHKATIHAWERNRLSFEKMDPRDVVASASQVSPRYLRKWLAGR